MRSPIPISSLDIETKIKYACVIVAIALSTTIAFHDVKAEEPPRAEKGTKSKNIATQREERVYIVMRKAAAYPVTDVAGCIGGVRFAASLYADLLRQGALKSEEYTKFSMETQLRFALENGTPVDMNAFGIVFEMLRANSASWAEVSENEGDNYAQQTALWEAITCKFNSGYTGIPKSGPLPKATVVQIVDLMIAEQQKSK
jgi:hypothetical protein